LISWPNQSHDHARAMASRNNRVYVSPPVYTLRSDRPSPTRVRNDRGRGPKDRKAPANEQFPARCDQTPFHPEASTSQHYRRAPATDVASRDATQPAILLSSAEVRSANVAHSKTNSHRATARKYEQAYQLKRRCERDARLCRAEPARARVSHKYECLSRDARYARDRCSASNRA